MDHNVFQHDASSSWLFEDDFEDPFQPRDQIVSVVGQESQSVGSRASGQDADLVPDNNNKGTYQNPSNLFFLEEDAFGDKYNSTIDPVDGISAPADSNLDFFFTAARVSSGDMQEPPSNDRTIPSNFLIGQQGYPGPTPTIEKTATSSSTMALQTQPVIQAEQGLQPPETPRALPGNSGSQGLDMTTKGPPHKCNIDGCGRTLASKSGLRDHIKRLSKLFRCEECQRSFGSKTELQRHQASIHTEEKPFRCLWPDCKRNDQGWPRQDNYRRHVRMVHGGEYAPPAAEDIPGQAAAAGRKRRKESEEPVGDPWSVMGRGDTSVQVATLQRIVDELTAESSRKDEELRRVVKENSDLKQELAENRENSNVFRELYKDLKARTKVV